MRCKLFQTFLFAVLVATCAAANAHAQEGQPQPAQDDEITTRGAFMTTRPSVASKQGTKAPENAAAPVPKKAAPSLAANKAAAKPKKSGARLHDTAGAKKNTGHSPNAVAKEPHPRSSQINSGGEEKIAYDKAVLASGPIGLGYTLFTRNDNGLAIRTDPTRQFRTGESVRLALEANTDGYLYIFHTENDGQPEMIFPDVRLNNGQNYIRAHVPYEIPSGQEATEETRWFIFKDPPAAERLYVVLTREPLAKVPTSETLAAYCSNKQHTCPWKPAPAAWAQLKGAQEREQVAVSRVEDQGRPQTPDEREASTRGLGLSSDAPLPTIIRMSASSGTGMLVTTIDLIHK
ncbi:MAG: DUF4384 domain-containing protein [Pyrinomonadaceae bacterium]